MGGCVLDTGGYMSDHLFPSPEDPDRQPALKGFARLDPALENGDLEHSDLDCRLRGLSWPKAPVGVKQRILASVLDRTGNGAPAARPIEQELNETGDLTIASERVHRHELSRRRLEVLSERVLEAPRRERRYASVL
jgi:hypothetical protein